MKTSNGTTYEGQWVNDVKHGKGRLTYPDGEKICGYWQNDRLNGLAIRTPAGGDPEHVIFKNDMLIMTNNSGLSCGDIAYMIVSFCLMVLIYGCWPLAKWTYEPLFLIFFSVYIIYVIWSCCH